MSDDSDGKNPQEEREGHYPPVSFSTLLFTFSSQAAVHLGLLENPLTGKRETDIPGARHFIDTLDLLQEKTKGNLTQEEETLLSSLLTQLKTAFISQRQP